MNDERHDEEIILNKVFIDEVRDKTLLTSSEEFVLDYMLAGWTIGEIAEKGNLNNRQVLNARNRLLRKLKRVLIVMGEEIPDRSNYDPNLEAVELRDKGANFAALAEIFGISTDAAESRVHKGRTQLGRPISDNKQIHTKHAIPKAYPPRKCAICEALTLYQAYPLCLKCFNTYGVKENWVKALIEEDRIMYNQIIVNKDVSFTDSDLDFNGEKDMSLIS